MAESDGKKKEPDNSARRSSTVASPLKPPESNTVHFLGQYPIDRSIVRTIYRILWTLLILYSLYLAYDMRLHSVRTYGKIIHEFDPWFNFRATQYLYDHGWDAFFHWYDYMSWYPLGRPVGTTIYPGLQITSVFIHEMLNKYFLIPTTLTQVCCLVPAWFGSIATFFAALLAYEGSGSYATMAFTAFFFSIVPAHLMRSMAGEYDNECIAVAAMLATFYTWVRSLRGPGSWPIGLVAGVAYGYMVSTWGGYVFVLNMVAVHAATCVLSDWLSNRYDVSLLRAYSLFFVVGTALAMLVPPVGWAPLRSLEQLMPLLLFIFMWALHFSERLRQRADVEVRSVKALQIRSRVLTGTLGVVVLVAALLAPRGYFGPISSRVRALFVQHTRTGNPLVDSVAEHHPSDADAYWSYLHVTYIWWAAGLVFGCVMNIVNCYHARTFVIVYSGVAYYFSAKMSRLMLLLGPAACILSAALIGSVVDLAMELWFQPPADGIDPEKSGTKPVQKGKKRTTEDDLSVIDRWKKASSRHPIMSFLIFTVLISMCGISIFKTGFYEHCDRFAHAFAQPQIIFRATLNNGQSILVDDYYVAYQWLNKNTPENARILSWWDYGYQITGIGNRTTLADGNTWNHEHIATIGKLLASPVKESHTLIRHLADYVLIWAGNQADDLMKSPHMARIGNSVYRDICPKDDPLCRHFGFYNDDLRKPTPMMRSSLLYNLHGDGIAPGVHVPKSLFQLVYTSHYGLVKIFKVMNVSAESKQWVADPKNRKCDPPGSWFCAGQYPPAKEIQDLLAKRIDYGQLEDFNRAKKDDAYYRAYMRRSFGTRR